MSGEETLIKNPDTKTHAGFKAYLARLLSPRGRSTRSEYIGELIAAFFLVSAPVAVVITIIFYVLVEIGIPDNTLLLVLFLLTICPAYATPIIFAHIRRLHDRGHSGWWVLLMIVPLVNFIMLLYLLFSPSSWSFSREDLQTYQSEVADAVEQVKEEP